MEFGFGFGFGFNWLGWRTGDATDQRGAGWLAVRLAGEKLHHENRARLLFQKWLSFVAVDAILQCDAMRSRVDYSAPIGTDINQTDGGFRFWVVCVQVPFILCGMTLVSRTANVWNGFGQRICFAPKPQQEEATRSKCARQIMRTSE